MCESGKRALRLRCLPARFVRSRRALPPHFGQPRPGRRLERLLNHPVAGVGASTALPAMAEVGLLVFTQKVVIEDVEWCLRGMVLADPEIPIRLDVKVHFSGQTSPVVGLAAVVLFTSFFKNLGIEQRGRIDAVQRS